MIRPIKRRKSKPRKLTRKYLKSLLHYNRKTGIFKWRARWKHNGRSIGRENKIAGTLHHHGYIHIKINRKLHLAHRLAWLYVYGYFPEHQIDHIDQIRNHNWISNLREATRSCNAQNCKISILNKSGITGVRWGKGNKRWRAYIGSNGKLINLGYYRNKLKAAKARLKAEKKYYHCTVESSAAKFINNYKQIKRREQNVKYYNAVCKRMATNCFYC